VLGEITPVMSGPRHLAETHPRASTDLRADALNTRRMRYLVLVACWAVLVEGLTVGRRRAGHEVFRADAFDPVARAVVVRAGTLAPRVGGAGPGAAALPHGAATDRVRVGCRAVRNFVLASGKVDAHNCRAADRIPSGRWLGAVPVLRPVRLRALQKLVLVIVLATTKTCQGTLRKPPEAIGDPKEQEVHARAIRCYSQDKAVHVVR
jgi:hypothetical protein